MVVNNILKLRKNRVFPLKNNKKNSSNIVRDLTDHLLIVMKTKSDLI